MGLLSSLVISGAEQVEWVGGFGQRRRSVAGVLNPSRSMILQIMLHEGQHAQPSDDNIKDGTGPEPYGTGLPARHSTSSVALGNLNQSKIGLVISKRLTDEDGNHNGK